MRLENFTASLKFFQQSLRNGVIGKVVPEIGIVQRTIGCAFRVPQKNRSVQRENPPQPRFLQLLLIFFQILRIPLETNTCRKYRAIFPFTLSKSNRLSNRNRSRQQNLKGHRNQLRTKRNTVKEQSLITTTGRNHTNTVIDLTRQKTKDRSSQHSIPLNHRHKNVSELIPSEFRGLVSTWFQLNYFFEYSPFTPRRLPQLQRIFSTHHMPTDSGIRAWFDSIDQSTGLSNRWLVRASSIPWTLNMKTDRLSAYKKW